MLILLLLSIALATVSSQKIAPQFEVCKLGEKAACSKHGTCASYTRNDKQKATRCICTYPYVGEQCEKKRFEAAPRFQKEASVEEQRGRDDSSSSSSSSSSSLSSSESESESESESSSSSESVLIDDSSSSSSSESDSSDDGGDDDDGHHKFHSSTSAWIMGAAFLVCLCICIPGIIYCLSMNMKKKCVTRC